MLIVLRRNVSSKGIEREEIILQELPQNTEMRKMNILLVTVN